MYIVTVGYTMDVMYFAWLQEPIEIDKGIELPQFNLEDMILRDCSQNYTSGKTLAHVIIIIRLETSIK